MILLVFLNNHDKNSYLMGRTLPEYLQGDYVKIFTRYEDKEYDKCDVDQTLIKIKDYAKVFDKVIVSFGLRLFPPSAYKKIITEYGKFEESIVFLKKLKGSKTWSIDKDRLSFDNYRIADTGLFILSAKDILESNTSNFNTFLKELVKKDKLIFKFVPYWIFTNRDFKKKKGVEKES